MTLRHIGIAGAVILLVAASALLNFRREIVHALLIEGARELGVSEFSVEVTGLGLDRATFENLRLDSPLPALSPAQSLSISGIELRYSPSSLMRQQFSRARLKGLSLHGGIGEGSDVTPFELDIALLEARFDESDADPTGKLQVSATGGLLDIPAAFVSLGELEFDLRIDVMDVDERLPSGDFSIGRIVDRATPPRFGPLEARGRVEHDPDGRLRVELELGDLDGLMKLRINGQHAPATGEGSVTFALEPAVLDEMGEGLSKLFPVLAGEVSEFSGRVELEGTSRWRAEELTLDLTLGLRDLGFTSEWGRLSGINATVSLVGPSPIFMPKVQRVTVAGFSAGVELSNAVIDFRLRKDGAVEISHLQWDFAKGIAKTHGIYDPESAQQAFTVTASGVDLGALLELVNLDGLSGEGTLAGEFPIYLDGEGIEFRDASLKSTGEGGWLRYRPLGAASALTAGDGQLNQLAEILENFRFDSIVISLNGNALGDVQVSIQLKGANPDFYDGFPVELNTNIESQFGDLIRGGTEAFSFATEAADALERSLGRRKQQSSQAK